MGRPGRRGLVRGLLVPWSGKGSRFGGFEGHREGLGAKSERGREAKKRQLSVCVDLRVPLRGLGISLHVAGLWVVAGKGVT